MHLLPARHARRSPIRARRRAFTFIEVMFAVMILGFGVIMVAVMIPVAIRQTQETRETNAGTAVIEGGFHQLETLWSSYDVLGQSSLLGGHFPATNSLPPPPGASVETRVVTWPAYGWAEAWQNVPPDGDGDGFSDAMETEAGSNPADAGNQPTIRLFLQTLGNRIDSVSGRTAWTPFYSREGTLPPFLALVGSQARNVETFPRDYFARNDNCPLPVTFVIDQIAPYTGPSPKGDFESSMIVGGDNVTIERLEPTIIRIEPATGTGALPIQQLRQAAVEGAALVAINARGQVRILSLSRQRTDLSEDHWELAAGGDVKVTQSIGGGPNGQFVHEFEFEPDESVAADEVPVRAFLVGRMLKDPSSIWSASDNPYVGPTQVVQILEGKMLR